MTMTILLNCPSKALWTAAAAAIIKSTSSSSSCCCCSRLGPYYNSSSRLRSLSRKSSSIEISTVASPSPLLLTSFISAYGRTSSSGKRTRHCSSSDGITTISATSYLAIARARASSPTKTQRKMSSISSSSTSTSYNNNNILQPQVQNRVALLQLPVTHNKDINLQTAITYIRQAHTAGAQLCVLPEIWNSPYATSAFPEYAELLPQVGDCLLPSKSAYGTTIEEGNKEAEEDDDNGITWGKSSRMLMEMAKLTNMYIVGGSIPEVVVVDDSSLSNNSDDNHVQTTSTMNRYKYYNTCLVINPHGKVVAKHRKVHLFDVNVPGGIQFKESETLTPGDLGATYFDVMEKNEKEEENEETNKDDARIRSSNCEMGRIGIGICYDIRFPEYALLLTQKHQCKILIYPGAFNLTTGPAHWELLQRARAVDGQCYVLTASPARMPIPPSSPTAPDDDVADNDDDAVPTIKYPHYSAWGHSSVVSPWGEVIATCDENPAIVMADLDMNKVIEMRMAIPTMMQKRHDLYRLVEGRNAPGDDNA